MPRIFQRVRVWAEHRRFDSNRDRGVIITAGQTHRLKMDEGHHRPSFKAVGTTAVAAGYMHQYKDGRESQPQDFTLPPGSPAISRSNSTSSTISSSGSHQPSYRGDYNYEKRPTKTLDLPFSPVSRDYEHNGLVNQIELEESVWTAAMVSWLLCPQELQRSRWGWMSFILPPQLALILCIVTQFFFAYFVYDVYHDMTTSEADCDNESSKLLHFFALCVFLSYGFGSEIMEALASHRWISCFPVRPLPSVLSFERSHSSLTLVSLFSTAGLGTKTPGHSRRDQKKRWTSVDSISVLSSRNE